MGIWTPNVGGIRGSLTRLGAYSPVGDHTEITGGAVAQVLAKPDIPFTGILIQTVDEESLFTLDGTDPTVEPGFVMPIDWPVYIPINDDNILTVARAGASDSSIRYQWVREES
jgi:hypothetical protein